MIRYVLDRVLMTHRVMDSIGLIQRTVEMSKVYTVNFNSTWTRGSQYKIEAHISRLARANGFLLLSATKRQVSAQPMLKCCSLILEPAKQYFVE